MFDKMYTFRGSHGEKVLKLTNQCDGAGNKLFARNLDVYLLAPLVGFLYQKKAEKNSVGEKETKVFPEQIMQNQKDLLFQYRLIILLDGKYEANVENRVDKAFRFYGSDEAKDDEELYNQYVLGGVDKIFEKLMEGVNDPEDYFVRLHDFLEEVEERWINVATELDFETLDKL